MDRKPIPVFETGAFNRSATSPGEAANTLAQTGPAEPCPEPARRFRLRGASILLPLLAGCMWRAAGGADSRAKSARLVPRPVPGAGLAEWTARRHVRGVVDLSSPRSGGAIVVAARGHLYTLDPRCRANPVCAAVRGASRVGALYRPVPRIAGPGRGLRVRTRRDLCAAPCPWRRGHPGHRPRCRPQFAALPSHGLEDGITSTQWPLRPSPAGHADGAGSTTVFAIDCRGRVRC